MTAHPTRRPPETRQADPSDRACARIVRWAATLVLLAVVLGASTDARADDGKVPQGMDVWTTENFTFDFKLGHKMGPLAMLNLHQRAITPGAVTLVMPGVGWDFSHGVTLYAGYYWLATFDQPTDPKRVDQHFLFQQIQVAGQVGLANLSGRVRPEEWWQEGNSGWGYRMRLMARAGLAVTEKWGFAIWDEAFLAMNTTTKRHAGFDQNRAFVGPYFQGPVGVRVEVGYMNHVVRAGTSTDLAVNHVAAANLYVTIPAKKRGTIPPPAGAPPNQPGRTAPGAGGS